MTTIAEFNIDELVVQLHEELKLAFQLAQVDNLSDNYQIESVKARMGRKDSSNVENEANLNVLNTALYPDEEDWEIEVSYSKKDQISLYKIPFVKQNDRFLLEKLKNFPLSSLKGISEHWQKIFAEKNVRTLGEMISFPQAEILKLCIAQNSFLPLEFQTKASLLNQPIAFIEKAYLKPTLFKNIALKTEKDLKAMFGSRLTNIEVRELRRISNLLMMVLDKDVYLSLSLEILY